MVLFINFIGNERGGFLMTEEQRMPNFFFKDTQVLACRNKRLKENKKNDIRGTGATIPYPASLKNEDSEELKIAWNVWYNLALLIRDKVGNFDNHGKALSTFGFRDGKITLKLQPCAAIRSGLPEISTFPYPELNPFAVYNEIVKKMIK
ncbi:MAG: hypothetical protein A3B04_03200 [Candidatus Portnoybacteria bacterium RIFCSPLOWO2_02_FULL_39_11]|uniref:Uncharacterized protein n=1 Tax=Candidatus Portnoybacteria bacterium RIFCSPLOWO2_02_FULL_39_11 TaxID=1802001 RepID=A0A1G2FTT7_9BACT|nr:MAG: hypothetical protein A3B04_03200 [Candidatus Portnoybacteria bacterium RIFCSPLOWO2_02_FULL_39_11]